MSPVIELQLKLLGDRGRNEAFARALKKVIRRGESTVADIGSGSGYLSFLARKLGARECFLYEHDEELLEISRKIAEVNGIEGCHFYPLHSAEVRRLLRANIVVSETLGNFALEENILETLQDAARFLKPGGVMMPSKLEQFAVPVVSPRLARELVPLDHLGFELDVEPLRKAAFHNMFVAKIRPVDMLESGKKDSLKKWDDIDFRKKNSSVRKGNAEWKLKNPAEIHGFGVWWKSELIPGVSISTGPFDSPTHWDQIFLPLHPVLHCGRGERLHLEISTDSRWEVGIRVRWGARIFSSQGTMRQEVVMHT